MSRSWKLGALGLTAVLIGGLLGVGALNMLHSRADRTVGQKRVTGREGHASVANATHFTGPVVPAGMCGEPVTLAQAAESHDWPIFVGTDELASAENMKQVLSCPDDEVIIDFTSGVRITTTNEGPPADERAFWEKLAAQAPKGLMTVEQVNGVFGAATDPTMDPTGESAGGIDLFIDGVQVSVIGDGRIPLSDLLRVAGSLQAN